ncbi:hypothetical protein Tco_0114961 [Tanacetum coccineum]
MECQVESLMKNEVLLDYEVGFTFPERPYQEEFKRRILNLMDHQEDQIRQLEEDMRKTKDTFMCTYAIVVEVFDLLPSLCSWRKYTLLGLYLGRNGTRLQLYQSGFKNARTMPGDVITIPCDGVRINKGREPTLKKGPHDVQDPPNDRKGEKRRKRRKNVGESSSKSSKKDKALIHSTNDDMNAAKRKPNWFDILSNSNVDQDEDSILRLSTVMVAKKLKELIKKDELTIADLEGVGLEMLKSCYKNDVELEYHVNQIKAAM